MKPLTILYLALTAGFLASCSPINTQFSCNETAGDRCLSIEEVYAMTEVQRPSLNKHHNNRRQHQAAQTIWFSPWKDSQGQWHEHDVMIARSKS